MASCEEYRPVEKAKPNEKKGKNGQLAKHRVKQNWLKMYNKAGSVLRLEMVINEPEGFTVHKFLGSEESNVA